jgi:hypothetical protein
MRKIYILIFCLSCGISNAQDSDTRINYSPFAQSYAMLNANMAALANHGKLTQFTYFDLQFVNSRFQDFLRDELSFAIVGEGQFELMKPNKFVLETYEKSFQNNSKKKQVLTVKYNVFIQDDYLFIKSCEITGPYDYIIQVYTRYWKTSLNFEAAKKGELVVNYLHQDRIGLTLNAGADFGKIEVTNTTIKDFKQYKEFFSRSVSENK